MLFLLLTIAAVIALIVYFKNDPTASLLLCILGFSLHNFFVVFQEALAQISEYSEAGITVRGTYVPLGKSPPEGERKLYLAIESTSDIAVSKAKAEITRLIKEELLKLQTAGHHTFNKARYKVL